MLDRKGGISFAGYRLLGRKAAQRYDNGIPHVDQLRQGLFRRMAAKGFSPRHILDIGAHKAAWSADARTVWPNCRFTLVEPQSALSSHLADFIDSGPPGRAKWIQAGCGAVDGELTFTELPAAPDSSNFVMGVEEAKLAGGRRATVPILTVNTLCRGEDAPEIVKIDAEGLDLDVIAGASEVVGKTEAFFVEAPMFDYFKTQSFHKIIGVMHELGYEPYDFTDLNRRVSDAALALVEIAFAQRSGILRDHHGW